MRPIGRRAPRALAAAVLAIAVAGCGTMTSTLLTADPLHDLITVDQLVAPDFTVYSAATHVDATGLAAGDAPTATALGNDGLQSAATVEFQRAIEFGTSNGPVDVVATVERFSTVRGAASAYGAGVRRLDATPGAVPTSTGPLGDEAHSISIVRTTSGGLPAVEITVLWRVNNLINIIVTRGRYGGTRLDDALVLAGLQTKNEIDGMSP